MTTPADVMKDLLKKGLQVSTFSNFQHALLTSVAPGLPLALLLSPLFLPKAMKTHRISSQVSRLLLLLPSPL